MKQDIHPEYGPVVFRDRSGEVAFLTRSTIVGRLGAEHLRIDWEDGSSYPVVDAEISSASHPFWTGRSRMVDTEGRVAQFNRRYRSSGPARQEQA